MVQSDLNLNIYETNQIWWEPWPKLYLTIRFQTKYINLRRRVWSDDRVAHGADQSFVRQDRWVLERPRSPADLDTPKPPDWFRQCLQRPHAQGAVWVNLVSKEKPGVLLHCKEERARTEPRKNNWMAPHRVDDLEQKEWSLDFGKQKLKGETHFSRLRI